MTKAQQLATAADKLLGALEDGGVLTQADKELVSSVGFVCRRVLEGGPIEAQEVWADAYTLTYKRLYGSAA